MNKELLGFGLFSFPVSFIIANILELFGLYPKLLSGNDIGILGAFGLFGAFIFIPLGLISEPSVKEEESK